MGKVSSIITLDEWLQFELLSEYWLLTNPVGLWGRGVEVASGGGKAGWLGWCTTTVASVVLLMLLATPALSLRLLLFLSRSRGSTVTAALLPREHNGIEWRTLPIVWSGGARPRVMYTQKTALLGRPVYSAVDVFRPETRDRLSRDAEGGLLWCLYSIHYGDGATAYSTTRTTSNSYLPPSLLHALLWSWGSENRYKAALV